MELEITHIFSVAPSPVGWVKPVCVMRMKIDHGLYYIDNNPQNVLSCNSVRDMMKEGKIICLPSPVAYASGNSLWVSSEGDIWFANVHEPIYDSKRTLIVPVTRDSMTYRLIRYPSVPLWQTWVTDTLSGRFRATEHVPDPCHYVYSVTSASFSPDWCRQCFQEALSLSMVTWDLTKYLFQVDRGLADGLDLINEFRPPGGHLPLQTFYLYGHTFSSVTVTNPWYAPVGIDSVAHHILSLYQISQAV